jgi:vancomycin permeability regulator SanA
MNQQELPREGTISLCTRAKQTLAICLLILAVVAFAINRHVSEIGSKYIVGPDDVPKADVILVLGAWVLPDGSLSDTLGNRLNAGYELYEKGKSDKVIVSGDHGRKNYDEVNAMKKFLTDRNVPAENVFMDHAGFTTYESLYRAQEIFKVKKIIIVTQQYHLMRAVFIARDLGLEAYGVASDQYYAAPITRRDHIREILARNKAFFMTKIIKPKPTFLGEEIPITGDGRTTNDK